MANNYVQTSAMFEFKDTESRDRAVEFLDEISIALEYDEPLQDIIRGNDRLIDEIKFMSSLSFSYSARSSNYLWIYSDYALNVDLLAYTLQHLIRNFNMKPGGFMWADTCDKPRVDEFSGGACFVTKDSIKWHLPYQWLEEQLQKNRS